MNAHIAAQLRFCYFKLINLLLRFNAKSDFSLSRKHTDWLGNKTLKSWTTRRYRQIQ